MVPAKLTIDFYYRWPEYRRGFARDYCGGASSLPTHPLVPEAVTVGLIGRRRLGLRTPLISAGHLMLMPLLAECATFLGRHLLPSMVIVEHALALLRRQLLKSMVALQ